MTPTEAIQRLIQDRNDHHSFTTDILGQAELLGREALEAILKARNLPNPPAFLWLPSETKD